METSRDSPPKENLSVKLLETRKNPFAWFVLEFELFVYRLLLPIFNWHVMLIYFKNIKKEKKNTAATYRTCHPISYFFYSLVNLHLKNVETTNGSTTQQERRDTTGRLSDVIMH